MIEETVSEPLIDRVQIIKISHCLMKNIYRSHEADCVYEWIRSTAVLRLLILDFVADVS